MRETLENHGNTMGETWEKHWKPNGNHGKNMKNTLENHGKTIGETWENHWTTMGQPWEKHEKTIGKNIGQP